jgi:hypothetical protein
VFCQEQDIGLKRLEGQLFEQETVLNVKRTELNNQNNILCQEQQNLKNNKTIEQHSEQDTFRNHLNISREGQAQELNKAKF